MKAKAPSLKDWFQKHGTHATLAWGQFDTKAKDGKKEVRMFDEMQAEAVENMEVTAPSLKDWLKKHGTHATLAWGQFDTAAKDGKKELTRMLDGMESKALKKI